jgi:hypothetical protein
MNTKHKQSADMKTESITPEERTKGSDRYREDHEAQVHEMMVPGVRDNQQPDDRETEEGV